MANRVKKYEFRKTAKGTRLILWAPLERGGQTVIGAVQGSKGETPGNLMRKASVQALLPKLLRSKPV